VSARRSRTQPFGLAGFDALARAGLKALARLKAHGHRGHAFAPHAGLIAACLSARAAPAARSSRNYNRIRFSIAQSLKFAMQLAGA